MRFCGGCAAPLVDPGSPSALPPAPHGDRPGDALNHADRRLVTVLFGDISGFTQLSEKLDPEVVRDLITACFDSLVPCIERYGGTIDKFMGDEVMALFGAPQAHENDPERALRAALEMRDALSDFNRERGVSLGLHFGMNTGLVYAGALGGGRRQDYSVMGDAVNVAARLTGVAKSGEILAGADTYRQVDHLFEFQAAESLHLKGKADPIQVFRLVGTRATPRTSPRSGRGLSSPLVGRGAELAAFRERLDLLRAGEGGILVMTGDAGLGKSRLVAEVRAHAQSKGFTWLEGRTLSFGRTISYWPLLEIIQQDAGVESDDNEVERWAKLAGRIGRLFGLERNEILPYLATLLNIPLPKELAQKVSYLDGEAMGHQIYRATRLYFARLAREQPTVVVFEDLHWMDGSSAALLEHLLPLTREGRLLFCLVSRLETESALRPLQALIHDEYPERLTEISLEPLSAQQTTTLARNLVQLDDLPDRLRESVVEKAEGNPFYVEEVMRSLIDQGGLVVDPANGLYRVTDKAVHIPIPDTLQGVIMARIDRLDMDLKQVLRLASVIGRSFFYRILATIAEAERELDRSLADLETRELIREKARAPELEYIFKHALVQETTYENILLQRRKELHHRVAHAIETLFPDRLEEFYALLAYHYSKAEDWRKSQEYLFKAGDQAGGMAADTEALSHYEEALAAYTQAFGDHWDPFERARLERKIGEALVRRGEHDRAYEHLLCALELLGSPLPTSPGAVRRAIAWQVLVQVGHRLVPRLSRRSATAEAKAVAEERGWAYYSLFWVDAVLRPPRMMLEILVGLNSAERAGIPWASAWAGMVAFICAMIPLRSLAGSYARRGIAKAKLAADPMSVWAANNIMGEYEYFFTTDWTDAAVRFATAWDSCHVAGAMRGLGAIGDQWVRLLVDQGNSAEALSRSEAVIRLGLEMGDPVVRAWGQLMSGEPLYAEGAFAKAEENLSACVPVLRAALDPANAVKGAARLIHCYVKQGRLDEAQALLDEQRILVHQHSIRGMWVRNFRSADAATALLAAERADDAVKEAALEEAKVACGNLVKHGKFELVALATGYRAQGTYHWLRGELREAEKSWRKSLENAEKLGARYEQALTRLEIGRRLGDRTQLEAAEVALAEIGAAWDLAEARRLLGRTKAPDLAATV